MRFQNGDRILVYQDAIDVDELFTEVFDDKEVCEQCQKVGAFVMQDDRNSVGLCFAHIVGQWSFVQIVPKSVRI